MIIPRHKVCDICKQEVGYNLRYYKIKSKNYIATYGGCYSDNRTHDICFYCMERFRQWLNEEIGGNNK